MNPKLKISFIGGLETIGKNIMVIEDQAAAVIIDCGMTFPDEDMFGINIVIPNFEYIRKIKNKLKAVFITHGHEDHIGALGYLYREINVPIYGTKLTLAFADGKFSGTQKKDLIKYEIFPGKIYRFGNISIEPFGVCHSIPDGVGLIIEAHGLRIVHSGDFKLDTQPIDGKQTDLPRLRRLKDVDLLMCDSTNADQPGKTYSEAEVGRTFEKIFAKTTGRIVIASFSSNILRIQEIINVAAKFQRRVTILGRNMQTNFTIARAAGVIKCPDHMIFDISQVNNVPDNKVVVITTGSQGEKMSALTHMAKRIYEKMRLKKEDSVIISATPIPGNEKDINNTVDNLYRLGVKIYYDQVEEIHASGHACAEEVKTLIRTVKPKFFIPIHGEYKHLLFASNLAHEVGVRKSHTLILSNGDQVELDKHTCRAVGRINASPVLIDGNYFADPAENLFDERYQLSRSGMIVVSCVVKGQELAGEPLINGYGCLYRKEIDMFLPLLREKIKSWLKQYPKAEGKDKEGRLRKDIERLVYEKLHRRPKVMTNIISG